LPGVCQNRRMRISEYASGLATYNAWMNERLFACAAELSDAQRKQDLGAFFKSLHGTLNHILVADESWLQRFRGQPVTMTSAAQEKHADFEALRVARRAMDAEIAAWAAALPDDFADRPFPFYSVAYRKNRVIPGWAAVAHLFNHQTHHRGQATTLLMQLGKDPGATDLPWMPAFDGPA
jgi:uncharacterized damage-inducible protein DinB